MNESKHFLASKTIWVNVLGGVAFVATLLGFDLNLGEVEQEAIIGGILAVVNVILRFVTDKPVTA